MILNSRISLIFACVGALIAFGQSQEVSSKDLELYEVSSALDRGTSAESSSVVDAIPYISDPFRPNQDLSVLRCFTSTEKVVDERNATMTGRTKFIRDRYELDSIRQSTQSVSATSGFDALSFDASYSRSERYSETLSEESLIWLIDIRSVYPSVDLVSLELTDKGRDILKKAIADNNPESFFQRCGREYRSQYKKGATLQLIYRFDASSKEKAERIKEELSASGSYAQVVDGSADTSSLSMLRSIDSNLTIDLEVRQAGFGDGNTSLAEVLFPDLTNLPEVRRIALEAFRDIDYASAVLVDSTSLPISNILPVNFDDRLNVLASIEPVIIEHEKRLSRVNRDLLFIRRVGNDFSQAPSEIFDRDKLIKVQGVLLTEQNRIRSIINACYDAAAFSDCSLPASALPVVDYKDFYQGNLVNFQSWESVGSWRYERISEYYSGIVGFLPTFRTDAEFLVKQVTYYVGTQPIADANMKKVSNGRKYIFDDDAPFFFHSLQKDNQSQYGQQNYCWSKYPAKCVEHGTPEKIYGWVARFFNKNKYYIEVTDINNHIMRYQLPDRRYEQ